ncbi:hypothetical protein Tco_0994993, partial [Tanacetum coccineum]
EMLAMLGDCDGEMLGERGGEYGKRVQGGRKKDRICVSDEDDECIKERFGKAWGKLIEILRSAWLNRESPAMTSVGWSKIQKIGNSKNFMTLLSAVPDILGSRPMYKGGVFWEIRNFSRIPYFSILCGREKARAEYVSVTPISQESTNLVKY